MGPGKLHIPAIGYCATTEPWSTVPTTTEQSSSGGGRVEERRSDVDVHRETIRVLREQAAKLHDETWKSAYVRSADRIAEEVRVRGPEPVRAA
jgi:hypothetical protein